MQSLTKDGIRLTSLNFTSVGKQISELLKIGDMRITVKPWREKRSLSQNALLWMWNTDIANAINENSNSETKLSDEDIHDYLKDMFCPAKPVDVMGNIVFIKSTKRLEIDEMTFYLRRIEVWCAERGIKIRIPPSSEYHKRFSNE